MIFNKARRIVATEEQLNQRFNKNLVARQLKAMIDYDSDNTKVHRDVEKIHKAWMLLDADPMNRPRYFKVDHILGIKRPLRILVSEYSTMLMGDYEFENIKLMYLGSCHYAAPITKDVMMALGGPQIVSRMLLAGGVRLIAETMRQHSAEELKILPEKFEATLKALDEYYLKELSTIKA